MTSNVNRRVCTCQVNLINFKKAFRKNEQLCITLQKDRTDTSKHFSLLRKWAYKLKRKKKLENLDRK